MTNIDTPEITGIRVVAIPVADQDRALEFYRTALHFEVTMDDVIDELGTRWVEMSTAGAALALVGEYPSFESGRDTGVRLITPDAAALHAHLTEQGVQVGELLLWEGIPPMFEFTDPDGNTLYAMQ